MAIIYQSSLWFLHHLVVKSVQSTWRCRQ